MRSRVSRIGSSPKISQPFRIDNYEVFTSASIGIILSGNTRRAPEDFLRDADAAMYRAKESGKARYEIFDRDMHVRNMNLLQVETDLKARCGSQRVRGLVSADRELGNGLDQGIRGGGSGGGILCMAWWHPTNSYTWPRKRG